MIRFNNDYNRSGHPAILEALVKSNEESYSGYGTDVWCEKAKKEIGKYLENPASQIHFVVGGTQANYIVIASTLRPFEGVLSANSGHINVHETGAVENTGHKVLALPTINGKIAATDIEKAAVDFEISPVQEHIVKPGMVYISYPTELGTLYTKSELEEISAVCRKHGIKLFVDGARLGYGLAAGGDLTLKDLAQLTDAFTIGGTKCGAMFGEAIVINNPSMQPCFRSYIKQNGAMLAKGWLLGLQFAVLFEDGLYFDITSRAAENALALRSIFNEKGIPVYVDSPTNQQFFVMENRHLEILAKDFTFEQEEIIDESHTAVRFCVSWATTEQEIRALAEAVQGLD